jgi:hypothetical protein
MKKPKKKWKKKVQVDLSKMEVTVQFYEQEEQKKIYEMPKWVANMY